MVLDTRKIFASLSDMEQLFVEAEADARGLTITEVIMEIVREGLASEIMAEVFQPTDRQWKSH